MRGSIDTIYMCNTCYVVYTIDRENFRRKLNMQNILRNIRRPIPTLVAKVRLRNLDYMKNLQVKYFTGKNIPIYGNTCIYGGSYMQGEINT